MKKLLLGLMCVTGGYAMEDTIIELEPKRPVSDELVADIADLLKKYGSEVVDTDMQFRQLVVQYFKKESVTIESNILPHLEKKLRDSDSDIQEILEKDDKVRLKKLIHALVTDSIEDAFKEKEVKYDELKSLADTRLKRARYALITAVVSGVLGVASVFVGVYFGR